MTIPPTYGDPVFAKALALTRQPETCRLLCERLLWYAEDRDIARAVRDVLAETAPVDLSMTQLVERLAQLEAERAHFLDPNRPGE
jgi:hypothetical protein